MGQTAEHKHLPDGLLLASEAGAEVPARAAGAEADAGDDLGAAGHRVLQLLQPRHAPVNLRIPNPTQPTRRNTSTSPQNPDRTNPIEHPCVPVGSYLLERLPDESRVERGSRGEGCRRLPVRLGVGAPRHHGLRRRRVDGRGGGGAGEGQKRELVASWKGRGAGSKAIERRIFRGGALW